MCCNKKNEREIGNVIKLTNICDINIKCKDVNRNLIIRMHDNLIVKSSKKLGSICIQSW